jgi:glucosamine-6-phosphate deaminase
VISTQIIPSSIYAEGAPEGLIAEFRADKLQVSVFESKRQAETAVATAAAAEMRRLISSLGRAIGIFDAGPSQGAILDDLVKAEGIEWTRVIGFHLNELLGTGEDAAQSHRRFLIDRLVKRVPMAEFHGLRGEAANPQAVCVNYATLLKSRPPDFALLELDEHGCLASITPTACDFNDPAKLRIVEFDDERRGAISLTIPAIMACSRLFVIAADETKQKAAQALIEGEITTACPASILRTHEEARLFLDRNSAAKFI